MNTAKHLLSCSTCGQDFELPESCVGCTGRSSRTDTPVCPPFSSDIISVRSGVVPAPAALPTSSSHHEILLTQKKYYRRIMKELREVQKSMIPQSTFGSFTRGIIVGAGVAILLMRLASCLG